MGGAAVEPQLGEEDINSMTIEELREFINKGVAPTALQSGESNTDLVRFRKRAIAKLKGTSGTVIFLLLPFSVDNDMIYFIKKLVALLFSSIVQFHVIPFNGCYEIQNYDTVLMIISANIVNGNTFFI